MAKYKSGTQRATGERILACLGKRVVLGYTRILAAQWKRADTGLHITPGVVTTSRYDTMLT